MQTEEDDRLIGLEPQEQPGRRRVFYGWWLVGLIGMVMLASTVPVFPPMTVWFLALERHFGWTRAQLSWALTLIRGWGRWWATSATALLVSGVWWLLAL